MDEKINITKRIGIIIKRKRLLSNLTQLELSCGVGITQAAISQIENGNRKSFVNLDTLRNIAITLKFSGLSELIEFAESINDSNLKKECEEFMNL